jgi:hypothetical protein
VLLSTTGIAREHLVEIESRLSQISKILQPMTSADEKCISAIKLNLQDLSAAIDRNEARFGENTWTIYDLDTETLTATKDDVAEFLFSSSDAPSVAPKKSSLTNTLAALPLQSRVLAIPITGSYGAKELRKYGMDALEGGDKVRRDMIQDASFGGWEECIVNVWRQAWETDGIPYNDHQWPPLNVDRDCKVHVKKCIASKGGTLKDELVQHLINEEVSTWKEDDEGNVVSKKGFALNDIWNGSVHGSVGFKAKILVIFDRRLMVALMAERGKYAQAFSFACRLEESASENKHARMKKGFKSVLENIDWKHTSKEEGSTIKKKNSKAAMKDLWGFCRFLHMKNKCIEPHSSQNKCPEIGNKCGAGDSEGEGDSDGGGISDNDDEGDGGSDSDGHTHEREGREQTAVEPDEQDSTGDKDIYNELHFELLEYLLNGANGTSDPTVGMDTFAAEELICAVQEQGWPVLGSKVEACPMHLVTIK